MRLLFRCILLFLFFFTIDDSVLGLDFIINNVDLPLTGYNDITITAPIGGNIGETLGEQRLIVLRRALQFWSERIDIDDIIYVQSSFSPISFGLNLPCNPTDVVLASSGAISVSAGFIGAPDSSTWYPSALANALARRDIVPGSPDPGFLEPPGADEIIAVFNHRLDLGVVTCLGGIISWYYGLDQNPPSTRFDLLTIMIHEIGHGLGFQTYIDPTTGALLADGLPGSPCENGCPDAFSRNVYDLTQNLHWHEMTDAQRAASALNDPNVVWTGPNVTALLPDFLDPGPDGELLGTNQGYLRLHAPDPVAPGISISHWTPDATPDLLMEAFLTENQGPLDVTPAALRDIGWPDPLTTVDVPMLRPAGFFVLGLIFAVLGALRVRRDFN